MMENIESVNMYSINHIHSDVINEVNDKVNITSHDNAVHASYVSIIANMDRVVRIFRGSVRNAL